MEREKEFRKFSQKRPRWLENARWQNSGDKVIVKVSRSDWIASLLRRITSRTVYRQIELDEIGSFVWNLCDGSHTVADIAEALQKRYQLSRREAFASLAEFLSQLQRKGLINFEEAKEK
ncbi:MAG: PqqD family protein [Armatimonadetes bacterium]|nr:PqqD family protein [Armatimonadota bacterium]MDW8029815.1 PqqD family protein [Armatimonadota bacterium]